MQERVESGRAAVRPVGDARRYRAFLSYTSRDGAAGKRLFSKIDGYRPPRALRGRETPHGPVPRRLYPVFRDREAMSTSPDLDAKIQRALAEADDLIVLCSPRAAQSAWVAREIETFRAQGKGDRIHAVLLDGEPAEAFPPALRDGSGREPIAADLRRGKDGWTDGPLKAIAGVLGLEFDELKEREVARARVRARVNGAIALLFALLFAVAAAAAWRAVEETRAREAELTRAEAAILTAVEFIAGVVEEVAAGQRSGAVPTALAERLLAQAATAADGVIALAPDNPRLTAETARVRVLLSRHHRTTGDLAAARRFADEAEALYADLPPDRIGPEGLRLRSVALNARGDALAAAGDRAG
ncbi:MAG: toll/interleukin-1 receptor domain-containing protein, partial [Pseudomonadota bacterium]